MERNHRNRLESMPIKSNIWIYSIIIAFIVLFSAPNVLAQSNSDKANQFSQEAYDHLIKEEWSKAQESYKKALKFAPEQPDLLSNLGYVYFTQKKYSEARKSIEKALKYKPDFADAWTHLGNIDYSEGHLKKSLEHYHKALKYNPRDTQVKEIIAFVEEQLKKQGHKVDSHKTVEHGDKHAPTHGDKHAPTHGDKHTPVHGDKHGGEHGSEHGGEHEGGHHHGPEFFITLLISFTLITGAAMRFISSKLKFPYTIAMLLLGLGLGLLIESFQGNSGVFKQGLIMLPKEGNIVSPHLIIFVFLPALIFESAFSLDAHVFKKLLGIVIFLAGPALLVATTATGAVIFYLTAYFGWNWSLIACLIFGALISATDPVAVVAILRELGVPKRLGILIEGESLLNDGTAIVVFNLLKVMLIGGIAISALASPAELGKIGYDFLYTVLGGLAVGFLLSWALSHWIGRTFNDPLVEITLTVVLAYSCMLIGEGFFGVSGVMALVVSGLYMSSIGKTRISPEVFHFLHQFWEMLAYIANTLIFFLVGLIIAIQFATNSEILITSVIISCIVWVSIMIIRFCINFTSKPILGLMKMPLTVAETTISSWGGLRGAVSLALGLVIAQDPLIAKAAKAAGMADLPNQIFMVTAGVVFLTIIVNGTTTALVLKIFGYDKTPLPEKVADLSAHRTVLDKVKKALNTLSESKDLKAVSWSDVEDEVEERREELQYEFDTAQQQLQSSSAIERAAGYWNQALSVEREAYWSAFGKGTLSANAVRALAREIDLQQDRITAGDILPPDSRTGKREGLVSKITKRIPALNKFFTSTFQFDQLAFLYDMSYGESYAAREVLDSIEKFEDIEEDVKDAIKTTYQRYVRTSKERLEEMRQNLPELTQSIETRLANRIALNIERDAYDHLSHHGGISEGAAKMALEAVEEKMKRLQLSAKSVQLPTTSELLSELALFKQLTEEQHMQLANLAVETVVPNGDYLFYEDETGDSLFVIVRGAAHITKNIGGKEEIIDVIGGGDIVGEMALLTGEPRTASVRAATTVTLLKITRDSFNQLLGVYPGLSDQVWHAFMCNKFDSYLRWVPSFQHVNREQRMAWIKEDGKLMEPEDGEALEVPMEARYAFLISGKVSTADGTQTAPSVFEVQYNGKVEAVEDVRMTWLPAPPLASAPTLSGF